MKIFGDDITRRVVSGRRRTECRHTSQMRSAAGAQSGSNKGAYKGDLVSIQKSRCSSLSNRPVAD